MQPVRDIAKQPNTARQAQQTLASADANSFQVLQLILGATPTLRANAPTAKKDGGLLPIPACVCLSECSLPGLLGHAERYGRFGLVFEKSVLWQTGARPCAYVDDSHYAIAKAALLPAQASVFGLYNIYRPVSVGVKPPQDYTHEREWRIFSDIDLKTTALVGVLVPSATYLPQVQQLCASAHITPSFMMSLETMFAWGV